jgi:uncharacterized protein (TIGR00369 family)
MTTPIQITKEVWATGHVILGFKMPPVAQMWRGELESHDPAAGILRVRFPTRAEYANPAGMVMGGIVTAMLDDCMGPLVVAQTGGAKFPASTDLHTQFFKGALIGPPLVVEARIDRLGKSIAFTSAVLLNEKGEVCAKAVHTAMLMDALRP